MFSIQEKDFGDTMLFRLLHEPTGDYVDVLPELGGIVNAYVLHQGRETTNIIAGYTSSEDFITNNSSVYKSNFLFPFPNRVKEGKYTFEDKQYQLPINKVDEQNSLHGLVYDKPFRVDKTSETLEYCSITLSMKYEGTSYFPFPFYVELVYVFSNEGLICESLIRNSGQQTFPYGLGWHHYFKLEGSVDSWELYMPVKSSLVLDESMIPTKEKVVFDDFSKLQKIRDRALDTGFELDEGTTNSVQLKNDCLKLELSFNVKAFPFLQVYTPPQRESIAIEPMTCAPDAFNNLMGISYLEPEEEVVYAFKILPTWIV